MGILASAVRIVVVSTPGSRHDGTVCNLVAAKLKFLTTVKRRRPLVNLGSASYGGALGDSRSSLPAALRLRSVAGRW